MSRIQAVSELNPTNPRWAAVDEYTFKHLHPNTRQNHAGLTHAAENSGVHGLPDIASSIGQAKFLALQCQMLGAKNALEVGTLGGYTAIWLATQNPNLKVTTLEFDAKHADIARENFVKAGVSDRIECITGAALETIPKLYDQIEKGYREVFDFVFIDADKGNNWTYFDLAVKMARPRACIVVDNVVARGYLADFETPEAQTHHMVLGGREVVEKVGKDERVDAVVMQIVGSKDYDGFLMAVVK